MFYFILLTFILTFVYGMENLRVGLRPIHPITTKAGKLSFKKKVLVTRQAIAKKIKENTYPTFKTHEHSPHGQYITIGDKYGNYRTMQIYNPHANSLTYNQIYIADLLNLIPAPDGSYRCFGKLNPDLLMELVKDLLFEPLPIINPSSGSSIKITVTTGDGKTINIDNLNMESTIRNVKERVESIEGLKLKGQSLYLINDNRQDEKDFDYVLSNNLKLRDVKKFQKDISEDVIEFAVMYEDPPIELKRYQRRFLRLKYRHSQTFLDNAYRARVGGTEEFEFMIGHVEDIINNANVELNSIGASLPKYVTLLFSGNFFIFEGHYNEATQRVEITATPCEEEHCSITDGKLEHMM